MKEITSEQKKAFTNCRKVFQKIFDKYREQGLLTHQGKMKTCFSSTPCPYTYIYFDAQAITGQRAKNFGIRFNMNTGITYIYGIVGMLLNPDYEDNKKALKNFKDKEKWTKFAVDLVEEIKKETAMSRFIYKKAVEEA